MARRSGEALLLEVVQQVAYERGVRPDGPAHGAADADHARRRLPTGQRNLGVRHGDGGSRHAGHRATVPGRTSPCPWIAARRGAGMPP